MLFLVPSDSAHFRVVYDVRQSFPETALVAFFPLVFVLIGFFIYRQRGVVARFGGSDVRVSFFGLASMFVGGLAALVVFATTVLPDIGFASP